MIELKIGEKIVLENGDVVICTEVDSGVLNIPCCESCYFNSKGFSCYNQKCSPRERSDKKIVIFKEMTK